MLYFIFVLLQLSPVNCPCLCYFNYPQAMTLQVQAMTLQVQAMTLQVQAMTLQVQAMILQVQAMTLPLLTTHFCVTSTIPF
jgi:hypothetical protein